LAGISALDTCFVYCIALPHHVGFAEFVNMGGVMMKYLAWWWFPALATLVLFVVLHWWVWGDLSWLQFLLDLSLFVILCAYPLDYLLYRK
jgi:hypothetical protein